MTMKERKTQKRNELLSYIYFSISDDPMNDIRKRKKERKRYNNHAQSFV